MPYFLIYGVFALWVLVDGISRKVGIATVLWTLGTVILGPIVLPIYLAYRPLKQGEIREGGRAWNILKNFAILWTIVMVIVSVSALVAMGKTTALLTSDVARAGAGIGILIGMGLLAAAWFVPTAGAALLGFLLKKISVIEIGPTGPLVGVDSRSLAAGGWMGLVAVGIVGLIIVGITAIPKSPASSISVVAGSNATPLSNSTDIKDDEWLLSESVDKMDKTSTVILLKSGSNGASLTVRCMKGKTDAYIDTNSVVDNGSVRIRLDDSAPVRERWTRSTDYKALFAPDPVTFTRKLSKGKTLLFEFNPFQESERTVSFDIVGLESKLGKLSSACDWDSTDRLRAKSRAAQQELRQRIEQHVHPCKDQDIGKWCWSDPEDALFNGDTGYLETKEQASQAAIGAANAGIAFKK
jgi:hypothetical protein